MNTTGDANRSVRRTKSKLKNALIQLLMEKPAKDITVREIAELADVSRGTFYLYYRDVYDMIEKQEQVLLDQLQEITDGIVVGAENEAYRAILATLVLVQENSALFQALLGPNGSHEFVCAMSAIISKPVSQSIGQLTSCEDTARLVDGFFIRGFIGLVEEWLAEGLHRPPEHVATVVAGLFKDVKEYVTAIHNGTMRV